MKVPPLLAWIVVLGLLALLPVLPEPIGTPFHIELGTKVLIMAIFAASLQLLAGYTGLISLGHAAYFGTAAYAVAMLTPRYEAGNGWLLLLAAIACAALLAFIIGFLVMRTRGIYFIMVTLAFGQLVYFVFHDVEIFGGSDGTYIYNKPAFELGSLRLVDLDQASHVYWLTLLGLALTLGVIGLVLRSRLGHALVGIRHNEPRMRAAGFDTFAYKLASFTLGGALAGLAGFLYATQHGYVNPELVSWHQSGNALLMIILGGLGSMAGAVAGAATFVLLAEWFQDLTKHWQLLMGGFIILAVAWMPQGLAGGFSGLRLPRRGRARPASPRIPTHPVGDDLASPRATATEQTT